MPRYDLTYEYRSEKVKEKAPHLTLITEERLGRYKKHKLKCECSEIFERPMRSILDGYISCPNKECSFSTKDTHSHLRTPVELVFKRFEEFGATPKFVSYENKKQYLPFICRCGNPHVITWEHARRCGDICCKRCDLIVTGKQI